MTENQTECATELYSIGFQTLGLGFQFSKSGDKETLTLTLSCFQVLTGLDNTADQNRLSCLKPFPRFGCRRKRRQATVAENGDSRPKR